MLENATKICDAKFGTLFRYDGKMLHLGGQFGTPAALVEFQKQRGPFLPQSSKFRTCRSADKKTSPNRGRVADPNPASKFGGARSLSVCRCSRTTSWSAPSSSIARRCGHSPTSRSSWCRTSPPRPSSPSRTRGCSMNCAQSLAAADRHRRRAQGHQPLDIRSADGAQHAGRVGRAAVRCGRGASSCQVTATIYQRSQLWLHRRTYRRTC